MRKLDESSRPTGADQPNQSGRRASISSDRPEDILVEVDFPGIDRESLDVAVENGRLTIKAERKAAAMPGRASGTARSGRTERRGHQDRPRAPEGRAR